MRVIRSIWLCYRARAVAVLAVAAMGGAMVGCSDDDNPPPPFVPTSTATARPSNTATTGPTATVTAQPTSTATVQPTATATVEPTVTPTTAAGHDEALIGSSEDGAGKVAVEAPDHIEEAAFSACLGGEGDDCTGGLAIYTASAPGLEPIETEEEGLFPLADGTTLILEIVAIPDGMSITYESEQIDAAGESVTLGTLPVEDHFHVEYTIAIPGGDPLDVRAVTLRIRTSGEQYQVSEPFTLQFQPTAAG